MERCSGYKKQTEDPGLGEKLDICRIPKFNVQEMWWWLETTCIFSLWVPLPSNCLNKHNAQMQRDRDRDRQKNNTESQTE